jgi:hypothetical protein
MQRYNLPVLLLGTIFVVAAGAIPMPLKQTPEGSAIYVGIQYAYSDILIMNLVDKEVKQALALCFLVLFPWISGIFFRTLEGNAPLTAWKEAIEFAGTSFIIDSIMPTSPISGNKPLEELLQGIGMVAIIHAIVYMHHHISEIMGEALPLSQSNSSQSNSSQSNSSTAPSSLPPNSSDIIGQTLDSVGSFTTWRIGKRFANILNNEFPHLPIIHIITILLLLLFAVQAITPLVGASFPKVANDLLVMIIVLQLASSAMFVFQQSNTEDATILLFSGLIAVRLFTRLFV